MKTILTKEQIARVFSLYIGQHVLVWKDDINPSKPFLLTSVGIRTCRGFFNEDDKYISSKTDYDVDRFMLKLKPLTSLKEEDARNIARIIFPLYKEYNCKYSKSRIPHYSVSINKGKIKETLIIYLKEDFKNWVRKKQGSSQKISNQLYLVYQYLALKGYAIPLFIDIYHPHNGLTPYDFGISISI